MQPIEMNTKWEIFEKLQTAIRLVETKAAPVQWDEEIQGQSFDATLRIAGGGYGYLVVVDCLESEEPITEEDVQSFVDKAESARADLAILASTSDYTQEAKDCALKNGIQLLTKEDIQGWKEHEVAEALRLVQSIHSFRFVSIDGIHELAIPEEPEILSFFMREMKIEGSGINTIPERIIEEHRDELARTVNGRPQKFEAPFPLGTTVSHPNTGQKTEIKAFSFYYQLLPAYRMKTKEGLGEDPYLLGSTLKDELAKRNPTADPSKIESGYETKLEAGKYYYNPRFRFSYYCEAVKKSQATIVLIESYQAGRLVQARARLSTGLSSQFVEVTEQSELNRLARLYEIFTVSDKNLEERFKVFAKNMEGAECIDDLTLTEEQRDTNKADYFFDNREVISELKALQTDASDKIERILEPYRETPEWPLFFGEHDIQKILSHLPNREEINRKLVDAVTDSVETVVKKANKQIRETKKTFNLPDAGGLLIILNDLVEVITPNLLAYRVRKLLKKRTPEGDLRFPNISTVVIIGGAHYAQLRPDLKGIPILIIPNDVPEVERVEEFVSTLIRKWSAFDGQPLITIDADKAMALEFRKFSDDTKGQKGPMTVQEYWESEYRKSPYLRSLDKEELLQFGRHVFEEMTPNFIKGVPKAPREQMEDLMMKFTHFLEETRFRAIDMREFSAKLDGLKEKIDELYLRHQGSGQQRSKPTRVQQRKPSKAYKNKIGRGAPCPCQSGKTYRRCCGKNSDQTGG